MTAGTACLSGGPYCPRSTTSLQTGGTKCKLVTSGKRDSLPRRDAFPFGVGLVAALASPARAVIAIWAGTVTTVYTERGVPPTATPVTNILRRSTEKHDLARDSTGAFYLYRLCKDGAQKKIGLVAQGTFRIQTLAGDAKGRTQQHFYHELAMVDNSLVGFITDVTDTATVAAGPAGVAAAVAIKIPAAAQSSPSVTLSRQSFHDSSSLFTGSSSTQPQERQDHSRPSPFHRLQRCRRERDPSGRPRRELPAKPRLHGTVDQREKMRSAFPPLVAKGGLIPRAQSEALRTS